MPLSINPFKNDKDRAEIWTMLVERDIAAFVAANWSLVANDFVEVGFVGTHAQSQQIRMTGLWHFPISMIIAPSG